MTIKKVAFEEGDLVKQTVSELGEEHWWFWCPGCDTHHMYRTAKPTNGGGPVWKFNGDPKKPTFRASLVNFNPNESRQDYNCHIFVTDGMIQFLGDCTHHLKGKTVPVEPPRF